MTPLSSTFPSRAALMLLLAVLAPAISTLAGQTSPGPDGLQIFYWYILPALPFLALSALALLPALPSRLLIGAACGAAAAIVLPYLLLRLDQNNAGGANIGLGILLLAQPLYLPIFMIGGAIASSLGPKPRL